MENYKDFLFRINSLSKSGLFSDEQHLLPSKSIFRKVDNNNHFRDFFGDTIVFDLDHTSKEKVFCIIKKLYSSSEECFCEQLLKNTLHMTLHDLSNSNMLKDIEAKINMNQNMLKSSLLKHPIQSQTIKMKTYSIINMVNISLVLLLCPTDENEYSKLMYIYHLINEIKPLPYPFTPHITLAYYNFHGFNETSIHKLKNTVHSLNKESFEITLNTDKLIYQSFSSMNNFENVFYLI